MIKMLKVFFKFCSPKRRKQFYLAIFLTVLMGMCEAAKLPAIWYLFKNIFEGTFELKTILITFLIMFIPLCASIGLRYAATMLQVDAGYSTAAEKRIEIAKHLRYVPMGYFNNNSLGYITSVTTNTMEQLADIATRVVMLVTTGLINVLIVVGTLFFFDYRIGLVALGGVIIFLLFNTWIKYLGKKFAPKKEEVDLEVISTTLDYVLGIAEIKSYNLYGKYSKRFNKANERGTKLYQTVELKMIPVQTMQTYITRLIGVLMTIVSILLFINGYTELATTMTVIIASFIIYTSLDSVGTFSALSKIIERCVDRANDILSIETMDINGENYKPKHTDIELKNVSFSYDKKTIINDVSLKIKENSKVAFVGPSGSGKTTICHLMARFWDVSNGEILLDGKNVKNYSVDSLMDNFTFVFQNVYLFNDTILNNLKFGNENASMSEIENALKLACCEFVYDLPQGINTIVGEGGQTLSGGELQRLSIARAILKDSKIVILDEATANVDPENEEKLMKAIDSLTNNKTVIMIAHRLKTVKDCDNIFVLDEGRIVQSGTHDKLIKEEGIYKSFVLERKEAVSWKI
ncbi:MAG: ABC transporter ATP-binding protein/permease [Acholeplasmatales bacterium]|nr:ABC transporter ATP-binding protein/permease [Acholeplasmatales bacterium]